MLPRKKWPQWLREANTENAQVELCTCGCKQIIWYGGTWYGGVWRGGDWRGGTWWGGTWRGGDWLDGVWRGGDWLDGIWHDGIWWGGHWHNGYWLDGAWCDADGNRHTDGSPYSKETQKIIEIKTSDIAKIALRAMEAPPLTEKGD